MTDFPQDLMSHAGRTLAQRSLPQQVASHSYLDASWQPGMKNTEGVLAGGYLTDPGFGMIPPPPLQDARASMRDARVDDSLFLLRTFSTYADNHNDESGVARRRGEWETFTSSLGGDDVPLDVALDDDDVAVEAEAVAANAGHVRRALRMSLNHDGKQQAAARAAPPATLLSPNASQSSPVAPGYDPTWTPAGSDVPWCRRLPSQQDHQESRVHSSGLASSPPEPSLAPGSGTKRGPVPPDSQPAFVPWGASAAAAASSSPLGKQWQRDNLGDTLNPATVRSQLGAPLDLYPGVASTHSQGLESPGALLSQAAQLNWYDPPTAQLVSDHTAGNATAESGNPNSPQRAGKQNAKNKTPPQVQTMPVPQPNQVAPASPTRPGKSIDTTVHKTLMVRNIPMRYTQDMLLVEWPPQGSYDFLYLPICIDKKRNASFAFVNFITTEAAQAFYRRWHKQRLEHYSARKPLDISPADVQGREENLLQIMRNKTFRIRNAHFQPAIFEGSERVSMEAFFEKRGVAMHSKGSTAHGQAQQADDVAEVGAPTLPQTMLTAEVPAPRVRGNDLPRSVLPKDPVKAAAGYGQFPLQSSALGGDLSALAAAAGLPLFPLNSRTEYVPYGMV